MTLGEFKAFVEGVMAAGTTDSAALKLILEKLKTVTAPAHLGGMFTEPPRTAKSPHPIIRDFYSPPVTCGIAVGGVQTTEDKARRAVAWMERHE